MSKRVKYHSNKSGRVKHGEYLGRIKHTVKHWDKMDSEQMAFVRFDGNKSWSKVPFESLEFLEEPE